MSIIKNNSEKDFFNKIIESKFFIWSILTLGMLLRIIHLGQRSFRMDEGFVAQLVKQDLTVLISGSLDNTVSIIFTIIIHFFYLLFGDSQFVLSLFSMICGVLLIYPIYLIGKDFFSPATGAIAAFLTAISPYHIFISQELRPYSMLCLLSIISAYLFLKISRENSRKLWYYLLICNIAVILTHITGLMIIFVENIVFFMYFKQNRNYLKTWLLVQSVCLIFYLPFLFLSTDIVKYAFSCFTALYDTRTSSFDFSKILKIPFLGVYYIAGYRFPISGLSLGNFIDNPFQVLLTVAAWCLSTSCFLWGIFKLRKGIDDSGWIIVLLCVFSYLLVAFPGGSILYLHVGGAAFMIIIAYAISNLHKIVVFSSFAGFIFISAYSLEKLYTVPYNTYDYANYQALADYIKNNIDSDEVVYFGGSIQCYHTWLYYYQGKTIFQHPKFAPDNFNLTMNYEIRYEKQLENFRQPVLGLLNEYNKVWIVLSLDSKRSVKEKFSQVFSDININFPYPDYLFTVAEVFR